MANNKKKNIKEVEIEEIEEIEEFDDEEFDFVEEDEEEVELTPKKKTTKKADKVEEEVGEEFEALTLEERVISVEKKVNIILVFVIITAILSLLGFVTNLTAENTASTNETEEEAVVSTYDTSAFTKITAQELEAKSKGKKIIVWIGRQGCSFCAKYVPTITQAGEKYGQTIYYLDLETIFDFSTGQVTLLDEDAYEIMMDFATDKDNTDIMADFGATPMTLIIKNNKIVGGFTGALPEADVYETLEDEGFKEAK